MVGGLGGGGNTCTSVLTGPPRQSYHAKAAPTQDQEAVTPAQSTQLYLISKLPAGGPDWHSRCLFIQAGGAVCVCGCVCLGG